jgi:hypothetical protein
MTRRLPVGERYISVFVYKATVHVQRSRIGRIGTEPRKQGSMIDRGEERTWY